MNSFFAHRLLIIQRSPWIPAKLRRLVFNKLGANIAPDAIIKFGVRITYPEQLTMLSNSLLNANSYIVGKGKVKIGQNVRLGSNIVIVTSSYVLQDDADARITQRVPMVDHDMEIGTGSWIGAGTVILPGVSIAAGCIIRANCKVSKTTEPNGLYVNMSGENGAICARRLRSLPSVSLRAENDVLPLSEAS